MSISRYWPLIALILVSLLGGFALDFRDRQFDFLEFMHGFMGLFLLIFATLKIFDLAGFHRGFCSYDLLAQRFPIYGYLYPFLELLLALGYLSHFSSIIVYLVTFVLFTFGSYGVIRALLSGLKIDCPCMGSILSVPLSVVTLSEDIGMSVMALLLLWQWLL